MSNYGNLNINRNKNRKGKKIIIALICIAVLILAFIFYIGITVGSNNDKSNQIVDAIQENTELKLKVNELNDQIAQMQEEIDSLHAELELCRRLNRHCRQAHLLRQYLLLHLFHRESVFNKN